MMAASGPDDSRGNRVVLRLRSGGDAEDLRRRAEELAGVVPGTTVVRVSRSGRVVLALSAGTDPEAAAAELSRPPDVEYAEQDVVDRGQPASAPRVETETVDKSRRSPPR